MTELERKALLGDKEAQKECTEKGIILLCPICGGTDIYLNVRYIDDDMPKQIINDVDKDNDGIAICCNSCDYYLESCRDDSYKQALSKWNTRISPPIGRCRECKYKYEAKVNEKGFLICLASNMEIKDDDYCSYFELKEK